MTVVPALQVSNLAVTGAGGRRILTVETLEIPPGAAVVVRGPSGAGKSTLLHALAGLIAPSSGSIRWGATELAGLGERQRAAFRRASIGFVFQEHLLFEELTVFENAAIAALYAPSRQRAEIRGRARERLHELGLESDSPRRSDTYSGGERQRAAVVRALASDPPIILADEPTASLDRANADALCADLFGLARSAGRTLIVVSHDPALQRRATHLVEIVDGCLLGAEAMRV